MAPIGVFDSGLGGLTAMRWLVKLLPGEDFVYFGDTARLPYGAKTPETILRFARQDIRFLLSHQVKMVVAACGTVSSVGGNCLGDEFGIPYTGVVLPSVQSALQATQNGKIGVIGTLATVKSGSYEKELKKLNSSVEVISAPCPLFVPIAEGGYCSPDHPITKAVVAEYIQPLKKTGIDTLILGCTHYALLEEAIARELPGVTLIDSGHATAEAVKELLKNKGLLEDKKEGGHLSFYVSDRPDEFERFGTLARVGFDVKCNATVSVDTL